MLILRSIDSTVEHFSIPLHVFVDIVVYYFILALFGLILDDFLFRCFTACKRGKEEREYSCVMETWFTREEEDWPIHLPKGTYIIG